MRAHRWLSIASLLWLLAPMVLAKDLPEHQRAFFSAMPELHYLDFIWEQTEGDLNGDGINDLAMLLTGSKGDNAPREERLVVLIGLPGGRYRLLSVSGEFCHPSKFYGLEIRKQSVFVTAVETADAVRWGGRTLQFRHNAKLQDLELIGEETKGSDEDARESEQTSTNLLTGQFVQVTKKRGKTSTTQQRMAKTDLARLSGYVCR